MSQTQNASLALFVLLCVTCLLRQASGFALQAAVGLRQPATENAIRTPAVNSCAYRVGGPAPQFKRGCAGAGSLRAALEVQQTNRLEPGTVLVAGPDNYGHTAFKAVALVYEHGEGYTTKAVCVDKGLDFLVGEMTSADCGPLADNRLFRGGEDGGPAAIMIHERNLPGSRALGNTGLFVGGFQAALYLVTRGGAQPKEFKFFFNHMSWPDGKIQEQVQNGLWKLVKLPNKLLLDDRRTRDMELWGRIDHAMDGKWKQ